jgi:hypothetical protein
VNFPDLETCKAIKDEFKKSDWKTWIAFNMRHIEHIYIYPDIPDCAISAPCESDLTDWLWEKKLQIWQIDNESFKLLEIDGTEFYFKNGPVLFEAKTKAQAKAEAVKLILEEK